MYLLGWVVGKCAKNLKVIKMGVFQWEKFQKIIAFFILTVQNFWYYRIFDTEFGILILTISVKNYKFCNFLQIYNLYDFMLLREDIYFIFNCIVEPTIVDGGRNGSAKIAKTLEKNFKK